MTSPVHTPDWPDQPVLTHFANALLDWFAQHGRHDLPWQVQDPYLVWVSEIMLQQTQVKTVLNYYARFIQRFPDVYTLAQASWDEVAPYWAGLGYYARARNLHQAAAQVVAAGGFPQDLAGWMALRGIGRSTAGAILSLGQGQFGVIMDGNVKRVLARYFAIAGDLARPAQQEQLWQLATRLTPVDRHQAYTQAIMDLGATICTPKKPLCLYCPVQHGCQAYAQGQVLGYPNKISKAAVPTRTATVLMIQYQHQLLWQQRPAQGIWGGLTALPILDDDELINLLNVIGINLQQATTQFEIRHQFTHFTWDLHCVLLAVESAERFGQLADQLQAQPLERKQARQQALPRAMQRILDHLDRIEPSPV